MSQKFNFTLKLSLTLAIAGLIVGLRHLGIFQFWEWLGVDLFFQLRPTESIEERILLVGLSERDVELLEDSRLKDGQLARLVRIIKQGNPRAIGIDMFRERPVPPGHEELMEVFRQTPYLYGIGKQTGIKGDATYTPIAPPPIPSQQITDVSVILDGDDVQRRGFLYPVTKKQTIPSLGLALALEYLARDGIYPKNAAKQGGLFSLAQTTFYPFRNNTGVYVRADDGSYQILMNWRKAPFKQVSVTEVLDGQISPQIFRERVVIIGGYAPKLGDEFLTPFSRGILSTPRKLFGMEAQAQLTSQILSAVLDGRPLVKVWSEPWTSLWIVLWAVIGWACGHHRRWWQVLTFAFLGTCGLLGLSYTTFLWGWWLSLVPPVLALWLVAVAILLYDYELARRGYIKQLEQWNQTLEERVEQRTRMLQQQQTYKIVSALAVEIDQRLTEPLNRLMILSESVQRQETTLVEQYSPYLESIPLQHPEVRESLYLNLANLGTTAQHISDNLAQLRLGLALALPQLAQYLPRSDFSPSGLESLKDSLETAINAIRPVLFNDYQVDIREKVKIDPSLDEDLAWIEPTRLIIVLARIFDDIVAQSWLDERPVPSIEVTVETNPQNLTLKITTLDSFRLEPITLSNCQQALDYYEGKISASQDENLTQWSIILPDF